MNTDSACRVSASCRLAIAATILWCVGSMHAADTAPTTTPSAEPKGHQMRRYQAFARQAELPAMAGAGETTLSIGSAVKVDASRLADLPARDVEALAGQFRIPAPVIANVVQRLSRTAPASAAQLAQELRTAAVDYRFLQGEWERYHPPQAGQQLKTEALHALQAGDIAKAWSLYDNLGLPPAPGTTPPQPPANLRVVATQ